MESFSALLLTPLAYMKFPILYIIRGTVGIKVQGYSFSSFTLVTVSNWFQGQAIRVDYFYGLLQVIISFLLFLLNLLKYLYRVLGTGPGIVSG